MPLAVVLISPLTRTNEAVTQFDDGGEYWFLRDFWPPSSSSGKVIDLYGDAEFAGPNLEQLDGALSKALQTTARQPDAWDQVVGDRRDGTKVVRTVHRAAVVHTIETMRAAIARAQAEGGEIHFLGD